MHSLKKKTKLAICIFINVMRQKQKIKLGQLTNITHICNKEIGFYLFFVSFKWWIVNHHSFKHLLRLKRKKNNSLNYQLAASSLAMHCSTPSCSHAFECLSVLHYLFKVIWNYWEKQSCRMYMVFRTVDRQIDDGYKSLLFWTIPIFHGKSSRKER